MKRFCCSIVCSMVLMAVSACYANKPPIETENNTFELSENSRSTVETTVETVSSLHDIEINPLDTDLTFDKLLNRFITELDIDTGLFDYENSAYIELPDEHFSYAWDYGSFLEEASAPSYDGIVFYYPSESEWHQTRSLKVSGAFGVYEYEDESWAEYRFLELTGVSSDVNNELEDSSIADGYCFIYDTSNTSLERFYASYYFNDCVIDYVYNVSNGRISEYIEYIDLCNELGLPTSDVMTQIVLGDSGD